MKSTKKPKIPYVLTSPEKELFVPNAEEPTLLSDLSTPAPSVTKVMPGLTTRKMRVRHSSNFVLAEIPEDVEIPEGISETIPNQSLSVRELLDRQSKGISIPTFQPTFNGDLDLPDFSVMDLAERQEYIEANKQYMQRLRTDLSEAQRSDLREQAAKKRSEQKSQVEPAKSDSVEDQIL